MEPMTMMALASLAFQAYNTFKGSGGAGKDKLNKIPAKTPQQNRVLSGILDQLESGGLKQGYGQGVDILQQYLDPESNIYKNFEQPYMDQFEQQTVPRLGERFAGFGAEGGGLSSSGFGQALSSAGSNLQTQLASMKSGLQRSAISDLMNQYNQLTGSALGTDSFAYAHQPRGTGFNANAVSQSAPWAMPYLMNQFQGGGGGGGGNQFPLTGGYDAMFRQQGLPGY